MSSASAVLQPELTMPEAELDQLCIHCLKHKSSSTPWVPDNPGHGCTYGLSHEYPATLEEKSKSKQVAKVDKGLCTKCGLHMKNPASKMNGCVHEYVHAG